MTTYKGNLPGQQEVLASVSSENKESSPPRIESKEHQLEQAKQENVDPQGELAMTAAEVLILIASYGVPFCVDNATPMPVEVSSDPLLWFAGVVSSTAGDFENDIVLFPEGIDDRTLKRKKTKVDKYACKCNGWEEKAAGTMSLPGQQRKGRARRGTQRKDFQTEVLPSIASLSSHEAKEDLQIFEELVEAGAGTELEAGLRRRNAGKRVCLSRGRGRWTAASSDVVDGTKGWLSKQKTKGKELGFSGGCLTGWGKTNRRQSGQKREFVLKIRAVGFKLRAVLRSGEGRESVCFCSIGYGRK